MPPAPRRKPKTDELQRHQKVYGMLAICDLEFGHDENHEATLLNGSTHRSAWERW
jgi:hypothetical protein